MKFIKIQNRRSFLKRLVLAIVSLELLYLFTDVLRKGNAKGTTDGFFDAGLLTSFERGKVYPFSSGHFYLSCMDDGGLLAISTRCTHLGCTINFSTQQDKFMCPCHASAFSKIGEVLSPPATRALDSFSHRGEGWQGAGK